MTAVPEWMRLPRLEGWFADDLDHPSPIAVKIDVDGLLPGRKR
jgi:hypothetical protein